MTLAEGQTIGHYRVTASLGKGGMGEVWRATDEKLGREVALKLLPEDFARDPDRHARFEREARVLASLNHPNIATLYGLESSQESESEAAAFLVMELVEGEDLKERIARGPIQVDEAIPIALQIAEALEAAHEQGIVHRDLKPANIVLRPDGTVKVLDFGLAKAWEVDAGDASLSLSPTLTQHATAAGVILGTAGYMAPEQAAGIGADRRADIWAWGVVMWEMLTGHKLFEGETVSHVLASVLKDKPDLDLLPDGLPPRVLELIERSLRKKPKRRLQAIGDARITLEEYLADPEAYQAPTPVAAAETPVQARRLRTHWAMLALLGAFAVGALGVWLLRSASGDSDPIRFHVNPPEGEGFQLDTTRPGPVVVSPDGRSLAFSAFDSDNTVRIFVRALSEVEARPLSGTDEAQYPFWSPDSKNIGFFAAGKLKKVSASGGQPLNLCDAGNGKGGTWGSDGVILFAPGADQPIHSVPQVGGESTAITELDEERGDDSHRHPRFLPDGNHFIYLARFPDGSREGQAIVAASINGGEERVLVRSPAAAEYASGHLLYLREHTLLAQRFDPDGLELDGEPFPIVDAVALINVATAQAVFSASSNGVLAYQGGVVSSEQVLRWRGRDGEILEVIGDPSPLQDGISLSPTEDTATVEIQDGEGENIDVWVVELDRRLKTRFTFDPQEEFGSTFSPDGQSIVWAKDSGKGASLHRKAIGGSGEGELLADFEVPTWPAAWHPSGSIMIIGQLTQASPADVDLMTLSLDGDSEIRPWRETEFIDYGGEFSPDGRWFAHGSNESGQWEIYVSPFPGPGRKWQVSVGGGGWPRWRGDGDEILYVDLAGNLVGVSVEPRGNGLAFGTPKILFRHRVADDWSYDVTADGSRFLVIEPSEDTTPEPVTVVVNWPAAIEAER